MLKIFTILFFLSMNVMAEKIPSTVNICDRGDLGKQIAVDFGTTCDEVPLSSLKRLRFLKLRLTSMSAPRKIVLDNDSFLYMDNLEEIIFYGDDVDIHETPFKRLKKLHSVFIGSDYVHGKSDLITNIDDYAFHNQSFALVIANTINHLTRKTFSGFKPLREKDRNTGLPTGLPVFSITSAKKVEKGALASIEGNNLSLFAPRVTNRENMINYFHGLSERVRRVSIDSRSFKSLGNEENPMEFFNRLIRKLRVKELDISSLTLKKLPRYFFKKMDSIEKLIFFEAHAKKVEKKVFIDLVNLKNIICSSSSFPLFKYRSDLGLTGKTKVSTYKCPSFVRLKRPSFAEL